MGKKKSKPYRMKHPEYEYLAGPEEEVEEPEDDDPLTEDDYNLIAETLLGLGPFPRSEDEENTPPSPEA